MHLGENGSRTRVSFGVNENLSSVGRTAKVQVVDGRELAIKRQTHQVLITIVSPWGHVKVTPSLEVLPGINEMALISFKSMRERLVVLAL